MTGAQSQGLRLSRSPLCQGEALRPGAQARLLPRVLVRWEGRGVAGAWLGMAGRGLFLPSRGAPL